MYVVGVWESSPPTAYDVRQPEPSRHRNAGHFTTCDWIAKGYAEMLFQVLSEREEESSIGIVSNETFTGWPAPRRTRPAD